jgi:hypothetical protein
MKSSTYDDSSGMPATPEKDLCGSCFRKTEVMRWGLRELLNPWGEVRRQREHIERLAQTIANPTLAGINIGNGSLGVEMEGTGPLLVAGMFLGMFENHPEAENYIECRLSSPQGPLVVTVVRAGGKTPHELRMEAERKLAEAMTPNTN